MILVAWCDIAFIERKQMVVKASAHSFKRLLQGF